MNNLGAIKQLLESGTITREEYCTIIKRLEKADSNYEKTWGELLEEFTNWCDERYSAVTSKGYKTCLYKFMLYVTKKDDNSSAFKEKFSTYNFQKVNKFINSMYDNSFSQQAISKTKYSLDVFGEYLRSIGVDAPDTKSIKISVKKEVNNTTVALKHEEIMNIAKFGELRNKVCVLLCYEGALRRIELSNIRVQDFNFENNQLIIYDNDEKIDRVCILTDYTIEIVKMYIKELYENIKGWNRARQKSNRPIREDYGYIFQNVKMVKPSYSMLQVMLKNSSKEYYESIGYVDKELSEKLKLVTFESIRNSRKVYLLHNGYSVQEVMRMCGDKNYMSTYRFTKLVDLLYPALNTNK